MVLILITPPPPSALINALCPFSEKKNCINLHEFLFASLDVIAVSTPDKKG